MWVPKHLLSQVIFSTDWKSDDLLPWKEWLEAESGSAWIDTGLQCIYFFAFLSTFLGSDNKTSQI